VVWKSLEKQPDCFKFNTEAFFVVLYLLMAGIAAGLVVTPEYYNAFGRDVVSSSRQSRIKSYPGTSRRTTYEGSRNRIRTLPALMI